MTGLGSWKSRASDDWAVRPVINRNLEGRSRPSLCCSAFGGTLTASQWWPCQNAAGVAEGAALCVSVSTALNPGHAGIAESFTCQDIQRKVTCHVHHIVVTGHTHAWGQLPPQSPIPPMPPQWDRARATRTGCVRARRPGPETPPQSRVGVSPSAQAPGPGIAMGRVGPRPPIAAAANDRGVRVCPGRMQAHGPRDLLETERMRCAGASRSKPRESFAMRAFVVNSTEDETVHDMTWNGSGTTRGARELHGMLRPSPRMRASGRVGG